MNLMKRLASGAAFTLLALAASQAVYAQETTSAIRGDVTGADGKPVAGASVAVVHTPSGTRVTAVTNELGVFDVRGLRIGGPYTVTVTGAGLSPKSVDDIMLTVGETEPVSVDYAALAGVTVVATRVGERETGPKTVLGREEIAAVATINRDIRDLARRDILVSQNIRNDGGISIAGSNPRTNRITIDGVSAQDPYGLETGGLPTSRGPISLDAVEQFSIAAVPTDVTNGNFTGGAMNMVLRSGGNDFHGSVFQNLLTNNTTGHWNQSTRVNSNIKQVNWGAFLSGPIIKDKLFFAGSYELFSTTDVTGFGPPGEGFGNAFNNVNRGQIDRIVNIFDNSGGGDTVFYATDTGHNYALGDFPLTQPITDRKYSGKIDWNISDKHRASLTYRHADSSFVSRADLSATSAALYSHWYTASYDDTAITAELNSKWTNQLSTDIKVTSRKWVKGQDTVGPGAVFSDVSVCTAAPDTTISNDNYQSCAAGFSVVRFGSDLNRHANKLSIDEKNYQGTATYRTGSQLFKAGYSLVDKKVFNLFLPNSLGTYYFDSIEDFAAGSASRLVYQGAISGNINDAAANLAYNEHSLYLQDTVEFSDKLKATLGVRYDLFKTDSVPIANPNFLTRNGYSNTNTIDGEGVFMPRISVDWKPMDRLKINAGGGLFSGGFPEVLFATPYYNTGYAATSTEIRRCVTGPNCTGGFLETSNTSSVTPGFTAAIGAAALNNLQNDPNFGFVIPQAVRDFQRGVSPGTAGVNPAAETVALGQNFKMPGEYKAYLSGQYDLGKGWMLQAQYIQAKTSNGLTFYDSRAKPLIVNGVQQLTPDGRIRYDGLTATSVQRTAGLITSTNPGDLRDIIASNSNEGDSFIASASISKSYDFGLDMSAGIAVQNINELNPGLRFGTTSGSLYTSVPAGLDPNHDQMGRGIEELGHRYKGELSYRHTFFGDNETRFTLFGERTSGRPYGFTMNDAASGRSPVFGVVRTAQALYIPNIDADTNTTDVNIGLVTFAANGSQTAVQARDLFLAYVKQFNLPTSGGILSKYHNTNNNLSRLDLQISQQIPTPWTDHKIKVQLDIRNLLNFMNSRWGRVEEYFDSNTLVRVSCGTSAGVAAGATSATCDRYIYSQVPTSITPSFNPQQSVWYAQIGLRYEF
jgi:hypothetical protein